MKVSHDIEIEEDGFATIITRALDVVRRRWLVLLAVTLGIFALAIAAVFLMTPKYTSVTHIRIDPSRTPTTTQQSDTQALSPEAIETEVSLLQSEDTARAVVRRLHLVNDPEFNKGLVGPMTPADKENAVALATLKRLDVGRDKLSYILSVGFTSVDRQKSADIANAFAQAYILAKVGSQTDTAAKKGSFLKQQLDALGADIRQSEEQLASYRAAAGLTGSSDASGTQRTTIVDQQVVPLSNALAQAQSDAAAATAALEAAQAQAARGGADNVSEVLASPVVGQLRAQRATTLQNMGEVLARYGDKHPEAVRVRNQLSDIDSQIKAEITRIMSSLQSRATAAQARAASLQRQMDALGARQATNSRNSVLATALEAEVASKRAQFDKLSQAMLESTQAANNSIASAEIVDVAKPPLDPTSPNKPLLLALGLIVALAAGAGTITLQELLASGLRSIADVEQRLGVPMLAAIPVQKSAQPADILLTKPTSLFAEALRIARASILGVRSSRPQQVIAITSALPSEGKTTTALAFARTLAINGQKTLLIDCDVRRGAMRQLVSAPGDRPGLVEVLHGEARVEQAIISGGDVDMLDLVLVRSPYFSSGNLFGDGKMEEMLASLRGRYELIVLDLPPLVGLADGRFIAAMADSVAMVLRWGSTPASAASSALSSLQADGANVAGVIFTMVDTNAEAVGGIYYSKKYAGYYQADA